MKPSTLHENGCNLKRSWWSNWPRATNVTRCPSLETLSSYSSNVTREPGGAAETWTAKWYLCGEGCLRERRRAGATWAARGSGGNRENLIRERNKQEEEKGGGQKSSSAVWEVARYHTAIYLSMSCPSPALSGWTNLECSPQWVSWTRWSHPASLYLQLPIIGKSQKIWPVLVSSLQTNPVLLSFKTTERQRRPSGRWLAVLARLRLTWPAST